MPGFRVLGLGLREPDSGFQAGDRVLINKKTFEIQKRVD